MADMPKWEGRVTRAPPQPSAIFYHRNAADRAHVDRKNRPATIVARRGRQRHAQSNLPPCRHVLPSETACGAIEARDKIIAVSFPMALACDGVTSDLSGRWGRDLVSAGIFPMGEPLAATQCAKSSRPDCDGVSRDSDGIKVVRMSCRATSVSKSLERKSEFSSPIRRARTAFHRSLRALRSKFTPAGAA